MIIYYKLLKVKIYCGGKYFVLLIGDEIYNKKISGEEMPLQFILPAVKKISYRDDYGIALTTNGRIYVWGQNNWGELGVGTCERADHPREQWWKEGEDVKSLRKIKKISNGKEHGMALTKSGDVYTWGSNQCGQLGRYMSSISRLSPGKMGLSGIKKIASGYYHSMALTHTGQVYAWGLNDYGQLGIGLAMRRVWLPEELSLSNVKDIICGAYHSMAIINSGEIYVWGKNNYFQLGLDSNSLKHIPEKLDLTNIKKISCGENNSMAITNSGEICYWGYNLYGPCHSKPTKLCSPNIKEINCGNDVSAFVTEMNEIYFWGKECGFLPQKFII
jgi:alpha-tubulin suppressor-like RCC1 family protein